MSVALRSIPVRATLPPPVAGALDETIDDAPAETFPGEATGERARPARGTKRRRASRSARAPKPAIETQERAIVSAINPAHLVARLATTIAHLVPSLMWSPQSPRIIFSWICGARPDVLQACDDERDPHEGVDIASMILDLGERLATISDGVDAHDQRAELLAEIVAQHKRAQRDAEKELVAIVDALASIRLSGFTPYTPDEDMRLLVEVAVRLFGALSAHDKRADGFLDQACMLRPSPDAIGWARDALARDRRRTSLATS